MIGMAPGRVRACGKEGYVSRAKAMFNTLFVGHETLAREYDVRFVPAIVPFITCGATLPKHDISKSVVGSAQNLAARLWRTAQQPVSRDFVRLKLHILER